MRKVCATAGCGAVIPPQQGSARPRKYCEECRPPRNRKNPRVIELPQREAPARTDEPDLPPLAEAYRKQLEQAERLETPEGAHVMHLAVLFASGQHTAAGAASLSRELRSAMETALRGAPKAEDALDELTARRRRKAAGA
jgi:hypothetical protein